MNLPIRNALLRRDEGLAYCRYRIPTPLHSRLLQPDSYYGLVYTQPLPFGSSRIRVLVSSSDHSIREEVLEILQNRTKDLIAVYQFGSTVRGDENDASDLDLAVLARRPLPNLERWDLQEEIAVQMHRDVDLVDLRSASTVMQMQVVATGTVIAEWDRTARQEFEMHTSSAYALLNEERAGILDDIQARGRIYG